MIHHAAKNPRDLLMQLALSLNNMSPTDFDMGALYVISALNDQCPDLQIDGLLKNYFGADLRNKIRDARQKSWRRL